MAELLGDDGTKGTVGAELTEITKALTNGTTGIQKIVKDVADSKANPPAADLNISAKFTELKVAVEKANKAIDEKLESGDLTQLDTSNLKALKSSINDIQSQIQSAFDDVNLDPSKNNTNVDPVKAKELLAALEDGVFKSNTELGEKVLGTVGIELGKIKDALTGGGGIQELVKAATAQGQTTLNVATKFGELKAAVEKANKAIDEKLNSGDLTQLDTSNLKALRSSINDIQSQIESSFADFGLNPNNDTNNNITPAKAKELLAALEGGAIKSNTELGEKAVGVATSSQQQAETIAEIRNDAESVVHSLKTLRVLYKDIKQCQQ